MLEINFCLECVEPECVKEQKVEPERIEEQKIAKDLGMCAHSTSHDHAIFIHFIDFFA